MLGQKEPVEQHINTQEAVARQRDEVVGVLGQIAVARE